VGDGLRRPAKRGCMPIQYVLLEHGSFVYARAYGALTVQDLIEHEQVLLQDPDLGRGYRQLLDCRWVSDDQIDESAPVHLAWVHSRNMSSVKGSRYAVVAQSVQWFQIGAHYRCERYGMTMIIFNDPSTACIWLGVDYRQLADHRWSKVPVLAHNRLWPVAVPVG